MKRLLFVFFILVLPTLCTWSQSLVETKVFSSSVQDSIPVKIWLPKNYSKDRKYPIVYEFIYDHSNYIAATASNMWDVPNLIVVWAQIKGGNEDYRSPNLSAEGSKYYSFIKNELINFVTREYNATGFKVAAGLSQGADYINYILRDDPSLFNAYLLFSTEYPIYYRPDFSSYTAKIKDSISYFIAIADDTKERVSFANQLYDSLKASPYLKIKKEHYPGASHSYSILYALPSALLFTFSDYNYIRPSRDKESLIAYYTNTLGEKTARYGNINYHNFVVQVLNLYKFESNDSSEIGAFLDTVYANKEALDIDLFNLGYALRTKKLYSASTKAYILALAKKEQTGITRMDDLSVYFQLFRTYDMQGDTSEALRTLLRGYEKTKERNKGLLYRIGYYYIEKKIDIRKGIEILSSTLNENQAGMGIWNRPKDEVYEKIATGYLELNNKKQAKKFIDKALAANPKNENALKLKSQLK